MHYVVTVSKRALVLTLFILLTVTLANAVTPDWQVFTEKRDIQDITYLNNMLWCASTGGLVSFNLDSREFEAFTCLADVGIDKVIADGTGIWLVFSNRVIQRFEPGTGVTHTVSTLKDDTQSINDFVITESGIYIAYDKGIALLQYREEYDIWIWFTRFTMIDNDYPESAVTSLTISDGIVWAGMTHGVARGEIGEDGEISNWAVYHQSDGLHGEEVTDVTYIDGKLYVSHNGGSSMWDGVHWDHLSSTPNILRLENLDGTLTGLMKIGIYRWNGDEWDRVTAFQRGFTGVTIDEQGILWAGLERNGSELGGVAVEGDSVWTKFVPKGPATNSALALNFAPTGELLMAGGRTGGGYGLCIWNGIEWINHVAPEYSGRSFSNTHRSISIDSYNNVWVGTYGGGIANYRFTENGELDTIFQYSSDVESGSRLSGIAANSNFVVASGTAIDRDGNIWVTNREASSGEVLICIPGEFAEDPTRDIDWHYFHRSLFGNFIALDLITIDGKGRKWMASSSNTPNMGRGVWVFDDNGTLDDYSDDRSYGPIQGLNQLEALSIAWDPAGYIWVGTIDGAYYINAETTDPATQAFSQIYSLINWPVYAITIDPKGNKWFGTNSGVKVIDQDLYTVVDTITTAAPDLLPDNRVRSIAVDPNTGWAYIGTENGMGAVRTPYRNYGENIDDVVVAPNPFNPNLGSMRFLEGLAGDASAGIYTPDGRLMRKLSYHEAAMGWDGYDDNGRKVANGIYLVLTYSSKGQAGQGKVAVIWK